MLQGLELRKRSNLKQLGLHRCVNLLEFLRRSVARERWIRALIEVSGISILCLHANRGFDLELPSALEEIESTDETE